MKKIILLIFIFLFSFAANTSDTDTAKILKKIPESSPNYSYALILARQIKTLKFTPEKINLHPRNEDEYLNSFYKLISLYQKLNTLPKQISEIQNKISILENKTTPISKLQMLYFQKLLDINNQRFNYLNSNLKKTEKKLFKKLKDIYFDVDLAKDNIQYWNKLLYQKEKELEQLKIDLQKWKLLNDNENIQKINTYISINRQKQKDIYTHLLKNNLIIWFHYLQKKNKKAFKLNSKLLSYASMINKNFYKALNQVIIDYEKYAFGAQALVYGAKNEFEIYLDKAENIINYPLFKVGNRIITPLNFAIFILVLIIGWFVGKYYKKFIYRLKHQKNISYSTATLLANMGYYSILTMSFLIALKVVGLDLSSLAIIAGALSVGIGFGLQNIVSNFVSGIILMFERSIKVGDYIQIDENTRGEVVDISMRSTIIRTNDNINLIIPNQSFIQNNVINWTLGDDIVRFRVPFGVAYGSDITEVEKVVLNAINKSNLPIIKKHPNYDVTPHIVFMEMGDSSLNFELFIWVKGKYARRPRRTRSDFLKIIYEALNKAGIDIPFPQQDLHIKDSVPFEITIKK